jgi:hypothetical protein
VQGLFVNCVRQNCAQVYVTQLARVFELWSVVVTDRTKINLSKAFGAPQLHEELYHANFGHAILVLMLQS